LIAAVYVIIFLLLKPIAKVEGQPDPFKKYQDLEYPDGAWIKILKDHEGQDLFDYDVTRWITILLTHPDPYKYFHLFLKIGI
jgi:hypothetical protein